MALAICCTAMSMKPSAQASGVSSAPSAGLRAPRSGASSWNFATTTSSLSGSSAVRAEHLGEIARLDLAHHHVGIGHRQRAAAAVTGRAGIGAGAARPDAKARAVEFQDRAAAGRHGVDAHHRRAHAHAGHLGLELALELAGVVRHVGGGAAHVEADHLVVPRQAGGARHADDAAGRARQDRVLALEGMRIGQAARRLHEEQLDARHLARPPAPRSGAGSATGRHRPPWCRRG